MAEERLQKLMGQAGIASRRESEKMIRDGRVKVNGRLAAKVYCVPGSPTIPCIGTIIHEHSHCFRSKVPCLSSA